MEFKAFDLGLVDFEKGRQFQKEIFEDIKNNYFEAALIICRHYPVITMGRRANKENIKVSSAELKKRAISLYQAERGGDVTYHGPGQLVAYPIFNLNYLKKDIHFFLRKLEETAIAFLSDFGIKALSYKGLTGVWVNGQKISSIGITVKNWITFHGMSINIKEDDLVNFYLINPCGMDIEMTSLEKTLGHDIEIEKIRKGLVDKFQKVFFSRQKNVLVLKHPCGDGLV